MYLHLKWEISTGCKNDLTLQRRDCCGVEENIGTMDMV